MAAKPYEGGCHCGAVRYQVEADLDQAIACNCSHCQAKGFILTFTAPEKFHLLKGERAQSEYLFNKRHIHHLFCATCGVQSFARGTGPGGQEMIAINIRALDGIDLSAVKPKAIDGRSA